EAAAAVPEVATATVSTLRQRLWKAGALVVTSARRGCLHLSESWPYREVWVRVLAAVQGVVGQVLTGEWAGRAGRRGKGAHGRPGSAACARRPRRAGGGADQAAAATAPTAAEAAPGVRRPPSERSRRTSSALSGARCVIRASVVPSRAPPRASSQNA